MTFIAASHFGSGGEIPYDAALRNGSGVLRLVDHDDGAQSPVELARFLSAADDADRSVLERANGAVLDIGCGPGRMVRAAIAAGHLSLGIDVSAAAVEHAQAQGLPVLRRSVFDTIPREGEWGAAILLDGNIGIGGDPAALLMRSATMVRSDGSVLVETHADPHRDRGFVAVLVDDKGRASLPFAWHELGIEGLRRTAAQTGLAIADSWTHGGRTFAQLCLVAGRGRGA